MIRTEERSVDAFVWRLTSVCRVHTKQTDQNWHKGSPRHTWLGHHFQGWKVKGQGHQAALLSVALMGKVAAACQCGNEFAVEKYCYAVSAWRCTRGEIGAEAYCVVMRTACMYTNFHFCTKFEADSNSFKIYKGSQNVEVGSHDPVQVHMQDGCVLLCLHHIWSG